MHSVISEINILPGKQTKNKPTNQQKNKDRNKRTEKWKRIHGYIEKENWTCNGADGDGDTKDVWICGTKVTTETFKPFPLVLLLGSFSKTVYQVCDMMKTVL